MHARRGVSKRVYCISLPSYLYFVLKERHRMKQLLAAQEILFPKLFSSLQAAMRPLMARNKTGIESRKSECFDEGEPD